MTGTAMTEDAEFREVYHVPVQVIPPNRPVKREDLDDLVYRTIDAKFEAVVKDVEERHQNGQPVLVGTVSIDNSERISRILSKRGIKHNVLNAKFHEREAQIIAQAGREGAVTIATNMAWLKISFVTRELSQLRLLRCKKKLRAKKQRKSALLSVRQ